MEKSEKNHYILFEILLAAPKTKQKNTERGDGCKSLKPVIRTRVLFHELWFRESIVFYGFFSSLSRLLFCCFSRVLGLNSLHPIVNVVSLLRYYYIMWLWLFLMRCSLASICVLYLFFPYFNFILSFKSSTVHESVIFNECHIYLPRRVKQSSKIIKLTGHLWCVDKFSI